MSAAWHQCGQIRAIYEPEVNGVSLYAAIPHTTGTIHGDLCGTVEFREVSVGADRPKLLTLNRQQAAKLMTDLWLSGARPSLTREQTVAFMEGLWAGGYRPAASKDDAVKDGVLAVLGQQVELMRKFIDAEPCK